MTFLYFPCHSTCQLSLSGFQPVYLPLPDSGFDTELLKQVKELEMCGVSAAEAGDLQAALQLFSQAIQILPQRASAYNNRAQALRLLGNTAGTCHRFNNISLRRRGSVPTYQTAESEASVTPYQSFVYLMHFFSGVTVRAFGLDLCRLHLPAVCHKGRRTYIQRKY